VAPQQSRQQRGAWTAEEDSLNLDHVGVIGRDRFADREEAGLAILVEHVDGALPGIELAGVEFAQMQHLPLEFNDLHREKPENRQTVLSEG
jgi:hypothetical protein